MGEISEETRAKILAPLSGISVDIADALRGVAARNQAFENCWLYAQAADEIDRLRKDAGRYQVARSQYVAYRRINGLDAKPEDLDIFCDSILLPNA